MVVVGLPRGGVPVAYEIARRFNSPLDIIIVRKLGAPGNPEYGIGAVAEDYGGLVNTRELRRLGVSYDALEKLVTEERAELERRSQQFRAEHPAVPVEGRTAILVDDGLATGVTATAAARVLYQRGAKRLILAVPVGAPATIRSLEAEVDQVVCLMAPGDFQAVGAWYSDFSQTTDEEVVRLLAEARADDG